MIKAFFLGLFLIFIAFSSSQAESLIEVDEAGKLQATLQNAPLEELKPFFEENYGIKFIGDESLFQTQVTVTFNKLSLEKTLKRIFSKMNVVFNYNNQGKITEVRLLPTSQNKTPPAVVNNQVQDEQPQAIVEPPQESEEQNDVVLGDVQKLDEPTSPQEETNSPPGEAIEPDANDEITSFQVEVNSPPSGDSFQIVPSPPPSFK